jgi:D-alanyl-D-alanine carboxypeptidase
VGVAGRHAFWVGATAMLFMLAAACTGPAGQHPGARQTVTSHRESRSARPASDPADRSGSTPKRGPGKHRKPAFAALVSGPLRPADVPFSWRPGCPVSPSELRAIHLSYVNFAGRVRRGEIIVNARAVRPVIHVFAMLYRARFPIKEMKPVDAFRGSDPRSMAADNTSGFNCRRAVAPGPPQWSMHAYGLAIDVNTVQNPYLEPGRRAQPPAGAAYANRADIRRGMAYPGGILVTAFSSIGWGWGGNWAGSPDYQHFSVNGR